jgi:ribosomal protein L30E
MNTDIEEKGLTLEESKVSARNLLGQADQARLNRAKKLNVMRATARKCRVIQARVESHSKWDVSHYEVLIDLKVPFFQCTCADHGQTSGPCKHVAAVLQRYVGPAEVEVSAAAAEVPNGVQGS